MTGDDEKVRARQGPEPGDRRHFLKQSVAAGLAVAGNGLGVWFARGAGSIASKDAAGHLAGLVDPDSHFFATTQIEPSFSVVTDSDGDLWPSCWADDDHVYTANGDGRGFGPPPRYDITVNRLSGTPETGITGVRVATGTPNGDAAGKPQEINRDLGTIWADPELYNRKPTGMLAVDGNGDGRCELYLAIQDLHKAPCPACFNDAPNATILRSDDYGKTWHNTAAPMFTEHRFTTVFFLDFGKAGEHARVLGPQDAQYVYAYGIDHNWRDPTDPNRPSPTDLYLGRVPKGRIQDRSAWQFFAGMDAGKPVWANAMAQRKPVLQDARTVYPHLSCGGRPGDDPARDVSVISQGGVVYNAPLKRYLYTSWTWYTFEFYEAPTPWGPWKLFLHKDFGADAFYGRSDDPACPGPRNGGYPTTIPSRYISADGRTMWVQSNTWKRWNFACGKPDYCFGLRKLSVDPYVPSAADNAPDPQNNLAVTGAGCVPIEKSDRYGHMAWLHDGNVAHSESSYDCDADKPADFWGYVWTRRYYLDRLIYTAGATFDDGGWFEDLRVQVRQDFRWVEVHSMRVTPRYPHDRRAGPDKRYVLGFAPTWGDGVRIIGMPGGTARFTTIAELGVYYAGGASSSAGSA
jgi:hypothetical protein